MFLKKQKKKNIESMYLCTSKKTKINLKFLNFLQKKVYRPDISFTVDEESEFETIKKIIEHFKSKPISCKDLINFIEDK